MSDIDLKKGFELSGGFKEGILLLHGFTGTPYEMKPAGDYFFRRGFNVFCPALKGHGTTEDELNKCSFYDWIESAELGLRYLKEKSENIYILGLSMGGLIALKLAAVHREIKKVIVIASPLYLRGENNLFVQATRIPIFRYLIKSVTKPEPRDERYRRIWRENPSYRGVPTRASYEFYRLMQNVRVSLKDVAQSIMLVYSRDDMDVHFGNLSLMISLIGSKDIYVHIEKNMGHLITLEEKNEEVFEKIYNFIQR